MKNIKAFIVLFLLSCTVFAQENRSFFKVKLYNQSSFLKNENNYQIAQNRFLETDKSIDILSPKFAIAYTNKNGNTHEVELNRLELNFNNYKNESVDSPSNLLLGGQETTNFNLSLRYEYTPISKKSKLNSKGTFSVSYGAQPYIYNNKTNNLISTIFPESNTMIGSSGYIAPRFTYQFSEKLFFDINLPFNLIDVNFTAKIIEDPTKTKSERTSYSSNFSMLPMNYNLRIGLAYRI
jgi:hypothetical protein